MKTVTFVMSFHMSTVAFAGSNVTVAPELELIAN
jgi:hypothetical protein